MNTTFNSSLVGKLTVMAVVVSILAFILMVWIIDSFNFGLHTASRLTAAVTVATIFCACVIRWGWKFRPFSWYLDVPVLEGTWVGHLESDWTRAAGSVSPAVPIVFVIRQTMLGLSIRSFTTGKQGLSVSAHILRHAEADVTKLAYIYSMSEEFRAGQGVQQGAAEVSLISGRPWRFKGEYWTNTKTRGRLILEWKAEEFVTSFTDAEARWDVANWCKF